MAHGVSSQSLVPPNILPHWTDQVVPEGSKHFACLHKLPSEQQAEGASSGYKTAWESRALMVPETCSHLCFLSWAQRGREKWRTMVPRKAAARPAPVMCVLEAVTTHPLCLRSTQPRCNTCALQRAHDVHAQDLL